MTDLTTSVVQSKIVTLPNRPAVMLDADLAAFYGTSTGQLNRAVRRNPDRFPERFAFQLTEREMDVARCHFGISRNSNHLALAFTQAGALAVSGVLKTRRAAEVSVLVFDAFAEEVPPSAFADTPALEGLEPLLAPEIRALLRYRRLGLETIACARLLDRAPSTVRALSARLRAAGLLDPRHG